MKVGIPVQPTVLPLLEKLGPMEAMVLATYAGCDIRCTYCIVGAQGVSVPRFPRDEIADRLRFELDQLPRLDRLGVGAFTDAYPTVEEEYCVTRPAIEVLVERALPFTLVTKGETVVRDIDLYAAHPGAEVQISICSLDEEAIARLDPGAPSAARRLEILHQLKEARVRVRLQASPWIPGVSDLAALLERVDPTIGITSTPLRLPPHVGRQPFARGMDQAQINEAFRQEYERVGSHPNLRWSRPPGADGAPSHISDNLGRVEVDDWDPARPAPDPGDDPDERHRAARAVRRRLLTESRTNRPG